MDILGKIGFDWQVALANLVNFLIIFWVLKRFVFKPVARVLEERKKKIAEGLEKSALAETALLEANAEKDRIVGDARQEANAIVGGAEKDASLIREKRKAEAEAEAAALMKDAKDSIDKERSRLESELAEKTVLMAVKGAESILKESIDQEKNKAIAQKAITTMNA